MVDMNLIVIVMIVKIVHTLMMIIVIIGIFIHQMNVPIVMEQDIIQRVDNVKNVMVLVKYNKIFLNQYVNKEETGYMAYDSSTEVTSKMIQIVVRMCQCNPCGNLNMPHSPK